MPTRPLQRAGLLTAITTTLLGIVAAPALAHVTVHPERVSKGDHVKLTFRVPNEQDHAATTKLQLTLPTDTPIPSVSVKPHPGWSFQIKKSTLDKPIRTGHGSTTRVVSRITWTADNRAAAIRPDQFDEFAVSGGPIPEKPSTLRFPAVQTYTNGDTVRWIQTAAPGAPEPEHPAPTLKLTSTDEHAAGAGQDAGGGGTTVLALSITALAVAVVAAAGAGYTIFRRRR